MIISHSRRFILLKSIKTAGTSVEAALSACCGGDDVVTPLNDFSHNRDESGASVHRAMNAEKLGWWDREIGQHVDALTLRGRLPADQWNGYYKISIARNPWDRAVSLFTWRTRKEALVKPRRRFYHRLGVPFDEMRETRERFARFVRENAETNDRFYIIDGQLCVDDVLRYESLAADVEAMRTRLGLPELSVPRLKTGIRPGHCHYSRYYDSATRDLVGERHANDIRFFGYRFEAA